jgi:hypothetical protein
VPQWITGASLTLPDFVGPDSDLLVTIYHETPPSG